MAIYFDGDGWGWGYGYGYYYYGWGDDRNGWGEVSL